MSNRMDRADAQLTETINDIVKEMRDPRIRDVNPMVTSVKSSSDFRYAKVMISLSNVDDAKAKKTIAFLNKSQGYIKHELADRLDMPSIPELNFMIDNSEKYTNEINDILKTLVIPPQENEDEIE